MRTRWRVSNIIAGVNAEVFQCAIELQSKQAKAKEEEELPQEATFKPKINSGIKKDQMKHFQVGQGSTGMQKYLMKQAKAVE